MAFDPAPSLPLVRAIDVAVVAASAGSPVLGVAVTSDGDVPSALGLTREQLTAWGFSGAPGSTLVVPSEQPVVAVGVGKAADVSGAVLRDAAAAFARAAAHESSLSTDLAAVPGVHPAEAAQVVVEGLVLGRYRYDPLRSAPTTVPLASIELHVTDEDAARVGAADGLVLARAAALSRDLANTPAGHLTAPDFADLAVRVGGEAGLEVVVHDKAALVELGCGGLLGVNAGSTVEPRMVVVRYTPDGAVGHLGLVGKGITYDSGGISLKPSNAMHAAMKMDMSGAGAVLAAMTVLAELDVPVAVSAYLALTDNMPSGSATKLGDVLVSRSGRTIEVVNTDAEGRLVMADAIALAREDGVEAIVDIATLTGAALAALGPLTAALIGNDDDLRAIVEEASDQTDERVWAMPLDHRYRAWMDSEVADIKNLG
ncbi:MAG TPA: M17 family peptidase N-terminal domain-containing protein, partial [Cellulomonas sp.]|nr:M17 family peptidase N-terminal domain-containing protein [Cellulomonas sp.]